MGRFNNAVVVVTGGASGIGEATTRGIIREGGSVLIADLQEEAGRALAQELGSAAAFHATDVTQEDDIAAAVDTAEQQLGALTGMVNNAGIVGATGSIMASSADSFDRTMSILSRAVFLGIKHAGRVMQHRGRGAIVSLASTAGVMGGLGPHTYTMAKHAVVGITKSSASELAAKGIRVNAVAPGSTLTPMITALVDNDRDLARTNLAQKSPLGTTCMPEDIANAIMFMLSDDARCMTGQTLVIDSGETCGAALDHSWLYSDDAEVLLHAGQREPDQ